MIRSAILNLAQKKGQVVYGARAVNPQLPVYLQEKTSDYDILTKKPKKSAQDLVNELKKYSSYDIKLEKAKHPGTYKVKVNDKTVADYTQIRGKPKTKLILGVKYKDLSSIKKSIQRSVRKPENVYRREKDLTTLEKIKKHEMTEFLLN